MRSKVTPNFSFWSQTYIFIIVLIAIAFLEFPLNGILQEVIFSSSATALLKGESIEEGGPVETCPHGLAPARRPRPLLKASPLLGAPQGRGPP